MRYQIYEAKSVKHDAQQRVGMTLKTAQTRPAEFVVQQGGFLLCLIYSSAGE